MALPSSTQILEHVHASQMLDFLGFIATAALMVLAVNAVITFMD
jgi:hypothetical protein